MSKNEDHEDREFPPFHEQVSKKPEYVVDSTDEVIRPGDPGYDAARLSGQARPSLDNHGQPTPAKFDNHGQPEKK